MPHLGTTAVLSYMGLGALLIFIGVSLLSVRAVGPLAWAVAPLARWLLTGLWLAFLFLTPIGWLYQLYYRIHYGAFPTYLDRSSAGPLARDNARRNPQRTASTAAALMIGLALVTLVAVLAAGITKSFRGCGEQDLAERGLRDHGAEQLHADPDRGGGRRGEEPRHRRRWRTCARARRSPSARPSSPPRSTRRARRCSISTGWRARTRRSPQLGADGAFTDKGYAKKHDLHIGSKVTLTFTSGAHKTFVIKGIFDPPTGGSPFGSVTISQAAWDAENANPQNLYSFVRVKDGASSQALAALERSLAAYPNSKVQTRQQFIDNQISGLNSILNVLYVLLALSVIVSLFGIVNTLVLTVFERTREIGMLRAIGMTRRAGAAHDPERVVITALIGGVIGIALGIVLGGLLVARVDFIVFALPVGSLIVFAVDDGRGRHPRRDLPGAARLRS